MLRLYRFVIYYLYIYVCIILRLYRFVCLYISFIYMCVIYIIIIFIIMIFIINNLPLFMLLYLFISFMCVRVISFCLCVLRLYHFVYICLEIAAEQIA